MYNSIPTYGIRRVCHISPSLSFIWTLKQLCSCILYIYCASWVGTGYMKKATAMNYAIQFYGVGNVRTLFGKVCMCNYSYWQYYWKNKVQNCISLVEYQIVEIQYLLSTKIHMNLKNQNIKMYASFRSPLGYGGRHNTKFLR